MSKMINPIFFIYKKYIKYIKSAKLLLILLILIMFTACNGEYTLDYGEETITDISNILNPAPVPPLQEPSEIETQTEATTEIEIETTTTTLALQTTQVQPPAAASVPAELTKEALLDDFDYLALTLKENFPFFGTARRKFGLDLQKQIDTARIAVQNLNTAGTDRQILRGYADILAKYIVTPMKTMGHLIGLWAESSAYNTQLALIKWDGTFETPWYPNLYAGHLLDIFTSPAAIRYYGNVLDSMDVDSYIRSNLQTPVPNNVSFKILQPDSVAYIKMNSMDSANFNSDGELIDAFGRTLDNFEHLIVDLRGNQGGYAGNFTEYIIAPLIDEPVSLQYYVFFTEGQHAVMFDDIYCRDLQWQIDNGLVLHTDAPRFPASDVLPNLTLANADDFAGLGYGFKREIIVNPSANRWAFRGRVWVLTDQRAYSAAEISAAIAKESGFATIVGDSTFGSFGGYTAAFINLPNTGIIIRYDYGYVTDLQGLSLEEFGVTPHIANRPGMDALETVLALIAE